MRQSGLLAAALALALMLAGCGADTSGEDTVEMPETGAKESSAGTDEAAERKDETVTKAVFPKELEQIPSGYLKV